jgi:hypothetical protein
MDFRKTVIHGIESKNWIAVQNLLFAHGCRWHGTGKTFEQCLPYSPASAIFVDEGGYMSYSSQTYYEGSQSDYEDYTSKQADTLFPIAGITPRAIRDKERLTELLSAMTRFVVKDMPIPGDWVVELAELVEEKRYVV